MGSLNWKPCTLPGPVTLRGRYVTLEPLKAERHGAALWEAVRDHDALWTWMANGPYKDTAEMMTHLEAWRAANHAVLLAIVPRTGEANPEGDAAGAAEERPSASPGDSSSLGVPNSSEGQARGWASFMRIKPAHGVIEVGNVLFSPALQRTRAATEAMYLMAAHVFDHLGYRRYEWKCNALNEASRRAALRLGFTFEGVFRQHMVVKDRSRDTAWFAMLDHEWPERKRAFEAWLEPGNFDGEGGQKMSLNRPLS
jgi:RimJ/RimL family protein N-acetyltransferase